MPNLLAIVVSPRGEFSTSRKLTTHFIDRWKAAHAGAAVVVRDLMKTPPPFVDHACIGGAFTPRERHSPESAARCSGCQIPSQILNSNPIRLQSLHDHKCPSEHSLGIPSAMRFRSILSFGTMFARTLLGFLD